MTKPSSNCYWCCLQQSCQCELSLLPICSFTLADVASQGRSAFYLQASPDQQRPKRAADLISQKVNGDEYDEDVDDIGSIVDIEDAEWIEVRLELASHICSCAAWLMCVDGRSAHDDSTLQAAFSFGSTSHQFQSSDWAWSKCAHA